MINLINIRIVVVVVVVVVVVLIIMIILLSIIIVVTLTTMQYHEACYLPARVKRESGFLVKALDHTIHIIEEYSTV